MNVSHPVAMASSGPGSAPGPAPGAYAASPPFVSPYKAEMGGPYSSASPFSSMGAVGPRGPAGTYVGSAMTPSGDLSLSLGPNLAPSASTNPSSLWGLGSGSVLGGAGFLGLGGGNGEGMGASGDVAGGNEYNILSEFLESLDGSAFPTPPPGLSSTPSSAPSLAALTSSNDTALSRVPSSGFKGAAPPPDASTSAASTSAPPAQTTAAPQLWQQSGAEDGADSSKQVRATRGASISDAAPGAYGSSLKGFNTKTEKFFLTAADQNDGTRDERLGKVIQAKYDAGLLRPYNHVNGLVPSI